MNTTQLIRPPRAPSAAEPCSDARRSARPAASELPTFGEMLDEILSLMGVVVVAGPSAGVAAGFAALVALLVCPPLMILVTLVVVPLIAVTVVVALIGAVLAMPYLLVRHLRGRRAGHAHLPLGGLHGARAGAQAAQPVPVESARAAA